MKKDNFGTYSLENVNLLSNSRVYFVLYLDLIEKLLNPNPKDRITLEEICKHPWFMGETISKMEYKKEISSRLKKVLLKVRK